MPSNPDICEGCGSQLFTGVWSVSHKDPGEPDENLNPKKGSTNKKLVGFKCVECGDVQLTREIPGRHARDGSLGYPDEADRDMVREG